MVRNVVLFISSAAVLVLAYIGYTALVRPGDDGDAIIAPEQSAIELPTATRPTATQAAVEDVLQIGPAQIPAGEGISFVVYDRFGNPTDKFKAQRWQKVAGKEREIAVTQPELAMRLPSGMTAVVTADEGQFTADRAQEQKFEPKVGQLRGNVKIQVDRPRTGTEATTQASADDRITVHASALHFDLEDGELRTDGPIQVESDVFDIAGEGLRLVWSRAANRVETLTIDRGRELTLYVSGGLGGAMAGGAAASQPATQPAETPVAASAPAEERDEPRITSYFCTLDGGVVADHEQAGVRRGGLEAEELRLLFDIGGRADRILGMRDGRESARRSARESGERLVIRWSGKLSLTPTVTPERLERPRRQLEALGSFVKLDLGDRCVVAGKLTYHDETQRVWLAAPERGSIELSLGTQLNAAAESIFFDRRENLVKLVGDVRLQSSRAGDGRAAMGIRCDQFAELRIADDEAEYERADSDVVLFSARGLRAASFVGGVRIDMDGQSLRADRFEAAFRAAQGDEPLEALLERATASGSVLLTTRDDSDLPAWLSIAADKFERPLRPIGGGDNADQSLTCGWLELAFARSDDGRVFAREIWATGDVQLRDRQQAITAAGKRLTATLAAGNKLQFANVYGSASDPARLDGDVFSVRGATIEFDPVHETMRVPGPSWLRFDAERTFRGQQRRRAEAVRVTCQELLQLDNKQNTIDFRGRVIAITGDEELRCESLALYLEDVAAPVAPVETVGWGTLAEQLRAQIAIAKGAPAPQSAAPPAIIGSAGFRSGRKEPVRLLARKALIKSEMLVAGDPQPAVHQSIQAPELDIDIRKRAIKTTGLTELLMIDRRLTGEESAAQEVVGLPSALVSRGPSQTALQCRSSMTYALGVDGPDRRDSVIFEGDVVFRHVAGKDMANLDQLFPGSASDPNFLAKLKSRDNLLTCQRLEGTFEVGDENAAAAAASAGSAGRTPMRLTWLNARERVYLVDKQGTGRREVHAEQLEFDRINQLVRVLGAPERGIDARVIYLNAATNQFDQPAVGPEFLIDLKSNTLKTGRFGGTLQRR